MLSIKERLKSIQWSKKKVLLVVAALTIVTVSAVLVTAKKETKTSASDYLTVPVQRGAVEYTIDGTGILQPSERYALKTWAGGTVMEVLVTEGTQVTQGQPLMRVQNEELDSQARQAVIEWEIAKSDLEEMLNPPSESDFDRRSAELKVEQYRIALDNKLLEKEKLVLKAPFDGKILSEELRVGDKVNAGTLAATVATTNEIEVVAQFSDMDINSLAVGMEAQVYIKGVNKTYTGKVKEIAFSSNSTTTGSFDVLLGLDKPDEALRPGMQTYNTVIVAKDDENNILIYKQAQGYLRYTKEEDLKTEVSGTVAEVFRKEGDRVYKGDPIMRLSNDEIDRQVRDAENQLALAGENLRLLLDPDEKTIKQQQIKVEQNYQRVLATREKLDSLNVVSPIDGVVVSIAVRPGDKLGTDTSSSGQELLVVCNFEKNLLEISVDELDINNLKFGQTAAVSVDAIPGAVLKGQVIGIAQEGVRSNDVTRYPVTLEVGYAEGVKGGMTATATIILEKKDNVLRIPAEALMSANNRSMVQVMENGGAVTKPVKTGVNNGRWVEITDGLSEGEQVVIASTSSSSQNPNMIRMPGMGIPGGAGGQQRPQIRVRG